VIEIVDHAELAERSSGDLLCLWAAQGLAERSPAADSPFGRSRAWRSSDGTALAIAGPQLSTRDRIAVLGNPAAAAPLVREVLDVVGPSFRPLGDPDLIAAIVAGIPELAAVAAFGWMDSRGPASVPQGLASAHWLSEQELPEVSALMKVSHPDSDAQPGGAGVERWAGVRAEHGQLVAITALAWSAPDVGYLAGVAVHPDARGQGHGAAVCGFVLAQALEQHGAAALMVEQWNESAIRLYRGLGMGYRTLTAAAVTRGTGTQDTGTQDTGTQDTGT
jgi:ribosomal protein S18 acetylase RimI-like enzyme